MRSILPRFLLCLALLGVSTAISFCQKVSSPRELPMLSQLMDLEHFSTTPMPYIESWRETALRDVKRDSKGTLWGLFQSNIVGSEGDLWIARHDGKHWTQPLFTGVNGIRYPDGQIRPNPNAVYYGQTETQLRQGGWFTAFVGNKAIARDTDRDGWTDLIEQRLGTDPKRADTDGDGLPDSRDRNPLAAPRELNDEEKVVAAVIKDALPTRTDDPAPTLYLISFPKGVKPFEVIGGAGICVPYRKDAAPKTAETNTFTVAPVSELAGQGIGVIMFRPPLRDFNGDYVKADKADSVIVWNADRTEAKVAKTVYEGPLNASGCNLRLRKVAGEWVIIERSELWVS